MESGECLGRECVWAGVVLTSLFLTRARVAGVLFLESIPDHLLIDKQWFYV